MARPVSPRTLLLQQALQGAPQPQQAQVDPMSSGCQDDIYPWTARIRVDIEKMTIDEGPRMFTSLDRELNRG